MEIRIRKGAAADADALEALYGAVCDALAAGVNYPGWKKGVYPAREDAVSGIREGRLFVAMAGDAIAGSCILRNRPENGYDQVRWGKALSYDKVFVISTFAVHPAFTRRGVGAALLAFAEQYAKTQGIEALRLDVYAENLPAIRLYERHGFRCVGTVDIGLSAYGLPWFRLYEKNIG